MKSNDIPYYEVNIDFNYANRIFKIDTDLLNEHIWEFDEIESQIDVLHLKCVTKASESTANLKNVFRNVKTLSFVLAGKATVPFKDLVGSFNHLSTICFENMFFRGFKINSYLTKQININKVILKMCSFKYNAFLASSLLDGLSDRRSIDLIYDDFAGSKNDFESVQFNNK